jgi:hypothetical protein
MHNLVGYFTGHDFTGQIDPNNTEWTWQNGYPSSGYNNAANFISYMQSNINIPYSDCIGDGGDAVYGFTSKTACSKQQATLTGTAFMVATMMGHNGTEYSSRSQGITAARTYFNDWSEIVRSYDSAGRINWTETWTPTTNPYPDSIAFMYADDVGFFANGDMTSRTNITFYNTNGTAYRINRRCGNVTGAVSPLSIDLPDYTVSSKAPSGLAIGATWTPGATVKNASSKGTSTKSSTKLSIDGIDYDTQPMLGIAGSKEIDVSFKTWTATAGYHTYTICADSNYQIEEFNELNNCTTQEFSVPTVALSINGSDSPAPIEVDGMINVGWKTDGVKSCRSDGGTWGSGAKKSINGDGDGSEDRTTKDATTVGTKTYKISCVSNDGENNITDEVSIEVASKPYIQAFSGDTSAGDSFTISNTCTQYGAGDIKTFNKGLAGGYAGSGTQLAAMAKGTITEFVSGALRTSAPNKPIGLTFANSAAGTWGGSLVNSSQCITDYWSGAPASPPTAYTNNGSTIGLNTRTVVYVDGDANINGSIFYSGSGSSSWNMGNMPSFWLIVKGDINISNTVTELNGVYIALPRDDGTKGNIYTCTQGKDPASNGLAMATSCSNQLTVYGAVIARQIKLLRTYGTLSNSNAGESPSTANHVCANSATPSSTCAAERFIYSPDVWLSTPTLGGSSSSSGIYDSISSLPPVL